MSENAKAAIDWRARAQTLKPRGEAVIDGRRVAAITELKTTWIDLA